MTALLDAAAPEGAAGASGAVTHVRGLLAAGELASPTVDTVVRATRDLDAHERGEVDRRLAGHDLTTLGVKRLGNLARTLAAEVAPEKFRARSQHRCTEPYCDAPARHIDHVQRDADGGTTTLDNGRGPCAFHDHVRERPGWSARRTPDGTATTTPTGHSYLAPPG